MSDKNKTGQKKEKAIKLSEDKRMNLMLSNKMKEMETEFDLNDHIVIDLGNAYTKIGFSGEDQPTITIPSIYARSKIYDSDKKMNYLHMIKKWMFLVMKLQNLNIKLIIIF